MRRLFEINCYRDAVRVCVLLVLVSVLASLALGQVAADLIGQPTDAKHYILSIGMPLIVTPVAAVPLVWMNWRLNTLRLELQKLARTDVLTGLMNRRAFFEISAKTLASGSAGVAVMMIDVDNFKAFNDTHGHDAGDAVLATIAKTLTGTLAAVTEAGGQFYLARIGGEEFALLVTRMSPERAERLAETMCAEVRATVCRHRGHDLRATVSVGGALGPGAEMIEQLLKAADTAVYQAKRSGRDRWCMATPAGIAAGKGAAHTRRTEPRAA